MKVSDALQSPLDLGNGHSLRWVVADDGETIVGAVESHPVEDVGSGCIGEGFIRFNVPELVDDGQHAKWEVTSWDPLTLRPSILCTVCGNHGHINNSMWVDNIPSGQH